MRRALAALLGFGLMCASTGANALCEGRVLFEDSFDDDLSGWVSLEDHEAIEDGQYLITPDVDGSFTSLLPTFFFDAQQMCIELNFEAATPYSLDAGIAFWGEDYDNYYTFQIGRSSSGSQDMWIYRRVDGRWVQIYAGSSTTFKVDDGVANTLQIDIDGLILATWVNGIPVKMVRAQRPDGRHRIGVYAQTDENGGTIAFNYIKITDPSR